MKNLIGLIEAAFCWEGHAIATPKQTDSKQLTFNVRGVSTVEHSGDVDGIRQQVSRLRGQTLTEDGVTYTIRSATFQSSGNPHGDEDYEVRVSGVVVVDISK